MKKNLKKLVLNKSTLSNLENENVIGGVPPDTTRVPVPESVVYTCTKKGTIEQTYHHTCQWCR